MSMIKQQTRRFDGCQIRQLIEDTQFISLMKKIEFNAWYSFLRVVQNFLGGYKPENYKELVETMLYTLIIPVLT